MEVIRISGYTESEKIGIAQGYLIPRQIRENGLKSNEISFTEAALRKVVRSYTREAGVRNMEREIGRICRKVATQIAEGTAKRVRITEKKVREYLKKPRYFGSEELIERTSIPGVATGLAYTATGGDVLFIEATAMPGNMKFNLTGSLGQVMQESAQAAMSYIRGLSEKYGIDENFWKERDVHLHVPAGAQPKDGPSAGITMAVALASLATGRPVRSNVGMTGEITLRGKVMPIGGVKEKVLAAHRFGLKTVILPKRNEIDLEDIPEEVQKEIEFHFVDTVDEVIELALEKEKKSSSKGKKASRKSSTKTKKAKKPKEKTK
jgi:ATP-dependent Lon protease